ncbi:hypothetical protein HN51_028821, partial [Arachis hypogaea]
DEFSSQEDKNLAHVTIKRQFHIRTTTELRDFVYNCPMKAELDRMEFRRYFILVVMKIFNWPLHTLKWLDMAVEKYKFKKNKICEGCMFVML